MSTIQSQDGHNLALKLDGTVTAWGKLYDGKLYDSSYYVSETVPSGLNGVVALAAGGAHSLALKLTARSWAGDETKSGRSFTPRRTG